MKDSWSIRLIQNMAVGAVALFFLIAGCVSPLFEDAPEAEAEANEVQVGP